MFALLKRFAIASTLLLLLNNAVIVVVNGAAWVDSTPVCYEDSLNYVCVGLRYFTTPSPATICDDDDPNYDPLSSSNNCTTVYMGGWSWEYNYVDTDQIDEIEAANEAGNYSTYGMLVEDATLASISVTIDDDKSTCEVSVTMPNKETQQCSMCSADGCFIENGTDLSAAIQFDCTNLETGRASNSCEPLEPFLNPVISLSTSSSHEGETVGGGVFVDQSGDSQSMGSGEEEEEMTMVGSGVFVDEDGNSQTMPVEEEMSMVGGGVFVDEDGNSQTVPAEEEEMSMVGGGVFVDEQGNSQSMGSSSSSSGSSREQIGTSEMGKGQKTEVMSTPQSSSSSIIQTGRRMVGLVLLVSAATAAVASMSN